MNMHMNMSMHWCIGAVMPRGKWGKSCIHMHMHWFEFELDIFDEHECAWLNAILFLVKMA